MQELISKIEQLIKIFYKEKYKKEKIDYSSIPLAAPMYDEREAISGIKTILSGWISQGKNVDKFEKAFSNYIGCLYGIAVNSGSSANLLALLSLKEKYNLQDGDEVIIPAATFATVAMPIIQVGFVPVYVDVLTQTLNIDPKAIESAITTKTKIIMPVHTLGYPADMYSIINIAKKYKLLILEDCCEAHGSSINGKKVGSFGNIASFSFFVAHNMTTGEGGMVLTDDLDLRNICTSIREFGRVSYSAENEDRYYTDEKLIEYDKRYVFTRLGYNVRMTDILAAFGIEQLKKLDNMNTKRRQNAQWLKNQIVDLFQEYLYIPNEEVGFFHTFYTFPIILKETAPFMRNDLARFLESKGIETRPLFGGSLPDQPAFRDTPGRICGSLDNSELLKNKLIFIGIHPKLDKGHLEYVLDSLNKFIKQIKS